ncbi:MAG: serine--tRNA ligase, partial [Bacteroidia bacterium]|nr:serine--tRNA ligase [Bacteroidia bacterium]
MLDINIIRKKMAFASAGLKKRNIENADELLNKLVALDDTRKRIQTILDEKLARLNALSKQIGELFKSGKREEAE